MARGDLVVFNVAMGKMLDGDWASSDHFYCAIVTNAVAPAADTATPVLGDFTEVTADGTYDAGGLDLGTLADLVTVSGSTVTVDSTTNPTWAQDASNGTTAYYAIIYNYTDAGKDALCYVDLGGPVDMTAGDLTITWNGSGLMTITKAA